MNTQTLSKSASKIFNFGKIAYSSNRKANAVQVDVQLKYIDTAINWDTLEKMSNVPEFLASGGIWNESRTDYLSCGQNLDELKKEVKNSVLSQIHSIWTEYHLNNFNAGTKAQTEALDKLKESGWSYEYTNACDHLKSIGLYEDRGYKYGHGWLYRPIPDEIMEQIKHLLND